MFKPALLTHLTLFLFCIQDINAAILLKGEYNEKANEVKINWDKSDNTIRRFILQHSTDERTWTAIAQQPVTDFSNRQVFQFFHKSPVKGKNYYRLQIINSSNQTSYSTLLLVKAEPAIHVWAIYPVPVGDVLTLQYKGTQKIMGVINITITGASGYVHTRLRCSSISTTIQIPVANLGKGVYVIQVVVLDEITWSQRFVK